MTQFPVTRTDRTTLARLSFAAAIALAACAPKPAPSSERAAWERQAKNVSIARDDWGVPHIHGKTDADAVFGLIYAQAEDDFNRVEMNYLNALGRSAEAEGESQVFRDLRMRLIVDPDSMKALFTASPAWLQPLMTAWADGLNYFLATHPNVRPKVIRRFEPWMALTNSEGSIGWDIETVSERDLQSFYGSAAVATREPGAGDARRELGGSNGIAIAPALTANGKALLLINPHTSFYYRAEVQVQSDEGLNAYGAVTWGQFFVYQGFNERIGWMHPSSSVDAIDEFAETVIKKPHGLFYRYGAEERPVASSTITIKYRTGDSLASREFVVYRTHHGPIVRQAGGKWIAVKLMEEPIKALTESYLRTKARTYDAFKQLMELHANSSNNTVYADADGHIAFFLADFVPKRNASLDWTRPVNGSDPTTDWRGLHAVDELPNVKDPAVGWIQNTNNWPYSAAGANSPRARDYPAYMDLDGENPRGVHAVRVLTGRRGFTLDSLVAAAFDSYLPALDDLLPPLFDAYRAEPNSSLLKAKLKGQIAVLEGWDRRWSSTSVATALAIAWGEALWRVTRIDPGSKPWSRVLQAVRATSPSQRLQALALASDKLTAEFGSWETPWGEINRFQRLTGDIVQPFSDASPSLPVAFTSARWGSLAAIEARSYPGTKRIYGTSGNSFVAVEEFGPSVRAKAITAGGESGDPASPHFKDQAQRDLTGELRDVYFYRADLEKHIAREYHPGS